MKIAITGSEGQLGSRLVRLGAEPLFCDVTKKDQVARELHRVKPDVVLHLAAQTSVDWCQKHYEEACSVNVYGTNIVCEFAEDIIGEGKVALVSSDMVFDGERGFYDENAEPNPINNYGLTKLAAEGISQLYGDKIIRISRCFDSKSKDISEYLSELSRGKEIFVPNFMIRSYCHLDFMAMSLYRYANEFDRMPEILHLAGKNNVSFRELMLDVARLYRRNLDLVRPRSFEVDGYSPRPHKTGLDASLSENYGFLPHFLWTSVERMKNENS